jgi:hypothetical protein
MLPGDSCERVIQSQRPEPLPDSVLIGKRQHFAFQTPLGIRIYWGCWICDPFTAARRHERNAVGSEGEYAARKEQFRQQVGQMPTLHTQTSGLSALFFLIVRHSRKLQQIRQP